VEAPQQTPGDNGAGEGGYGIFVQQPDGTAFPAKDGMQFLKDLPFVGMVGQVETAGGFVPEVRSRRDLLPDVPAANGPIVHFSRRLTDGPYHPEISDRGPNCLIGPFENLYRKSLLGEGPCRGQTYDTGANDYC
jgi:hypothetical protein